MSFLPNRPNSKIYRDQFPLAGRGFNRQYNVDGNRPDLVLDFENQYYSVNGQRKSPSEVVDFSRSSTATVTDSDGNIKWAPHNLFSYSEDFTNSIWNPLRCDKTGNAAVAPNGTLTADRLAQNSGQTTVGLVTRADVTVVVGEKYTFGLWAKSDTRTLVNVYTSLGGDVNETYFNLSDGTVAGQNFTDSEATNSIEDAVNGWYYCKIEFTVSATSGADRYDIRLNDTVGSSTVADDGGAIFVWGAHFYRSDLGGMQDVPASDRVETSSNFAGRDKYVPTDTTAKYLPRVNDYSWNGTSYTRAGMLVEESRTNLLPYSEAFDNAAWIKTGMSAVSDGTTFFGNSAQKFTEDSSTGFHRVADGFTFSAVEYTYSVFAKADERTEIRILAVDGTKNMGAFFDLSSGTVGTELNATGEITDMGGGIYRCTSTFTANAGSGNVQILLVNSTESYAGDGTSGVYIWGAQLEEGSFPTSYIPTTGSAATRAAEKAAVDGSVFSSFFNASEGTLYVRATPGPANFAVAASLDDGSGTDNYMQIDRAGTGGVRFSGGDTSVTQFNLVGSALGEGEAKFIMSYGADDFRASFNGEAVLSDVSGTVPSVSQLTIGSRSDTGVTYLNGHISEIRYFPEKLTNAQLQEVTS